MSDLSPKCACRLNQSMQHMRPTGVSNVKVLRGRHFGQISLRMHRQVGPLREVLPQQAIGVFIGTALARTLRIASLCLLD
jgi:hypothetical protein